MDSRSGPSVRPGMTALVRSPAAACRAGLCHVQEEFAHVPGPGGAAFRAKPAMQADVFVLHHDAAGLQRIPDIEVLFEAERRRHQAATQLLLGAVLGEGDAVHWADVDAGVAFDAELPG